MRLLLDTHTLLWWLTDDPNLSQATRKAISDTKNVLYVSAASAWEIATKVRIGRLPTAAGLVEDFAGQLEREGFKVLAISPDHALRAGLLPGPRKDPFDRMLIAQAQGENIPLVSNEVLFDNYGVRRIWQAISESKLTQSLLRESSSVSFPSGTQSGYSGFAELLAVEQNLHRYTSDIVSKMVPHFAGHNPVLEFGAGIGTLAVEWRKQTGTNPECLEIDTRQQQMIVDRGFVCYTSTDAVAKKFAGIYSSNVLEHIDDDAGMLRELKALMLDGGVLALYVPAFMCLFSRFDRYLGHYRRYRKAELIQKVMRAGLTVVECRYVDSVGFFAWYVAKFFGSEEGADLPSAGSLRFYDSYIYPVSKSLDSLMMKRLLGKNLLLIAKK